jgi:hypothetical protein
VIAYARRAMSARTSLSALALPLVASLLFFVPSAIAADSYASIFNGGEVVVSANADFTEAELERLVFTDEDCGTTPGEATCTWKVELRLQSNPNTRCDPTTPESQTVWSSGPQAGNGTISAEPASFPLEGCRGQSLSIRTSFTKTFEEGSAEGGILRIPEAAREAILFTFGEHGAVSEDRQVPTEYHPPPYAYPPFELSFTPKPRMEVTVAPSCRSVTIDSDRYAFAFHRLGCKKATRLLLARVRSGVSPTGYACSAPLPGRTRCWRRHQPNKYFEWRLPGKPKAAA